MSISKEHGPRGLPANTISPDPVETDLWFGDGGLAEVVADSALSDAATVAGEAVSRTATSRFTLPGEVADLVVMLAGARAGNVTGADIVIDGGMIETV